MKDWLNLVADEDKLLNKHYTSGRAGRKIDKVVLHHNAGNLSIDGIWQVWQTREASAHYQVTADGRIGQLVWDADTAWHAGNLEANRTSIGIEHADVSTNPWLISEATLDAGAHLTAAVCRYYGLGRPQWLKNVFPHSYFSGTECPCSIAGSQRDAYMRRAQEWYDKMTCSSTETTPSTPASKGVDEIAAEVIAGAWGNGQDRVNRLSAAGYDVNAVQQRVNELLGAGGTSNTVDVDGLARRVINGEFGNGDARRQALGSNYEAVQARVNELLGAGGGQCVDLNALADAVIRGDYGNGEARRQALGSNYEVVQAIVNRKLGQ